MGDDVHKRLAERLDRLPNGFPQTESRVEVLILRKIFSQDEAWLASQLSGRMETIDEIAKRVRLTYEETKTRLMKMAKRGLVWSDKKPEKLRFRLAPFIVGVYEAQLENMDHELAHLVEKYLAAGGAAGIMQPEPAIHRVVPAQNSVKSEWILPYDDVRAILLASKTFRVQDCICRMQQDHVGRRCNFPLRACLSFSTTERPPSPEDISQQKALAILDRTEEIGLVHTVSNVAKGIGYICNCCGCCCAILRGITEWGIQNSVAYANYYAVVNLDTCQGCGTCVDRCQVGSISVNDGIAIVDQERCIGCGLCVTGCPNNSVELRRKPDEEIVHPPKDYAAWERDRLAYRGLDE
ncbi:MAG: DUF362 domain-containing protein [Candidatus Hodarchaeota archaeon]